jgi:hypothetical protein
MYTRHHAVHPIAVKLQSFFGKSRQYFLAAHSVERLYSHLCTRKESVPAIEVLVPT